MQTRRGQGFTLVEMVVVSLILSIVMAATLQAFSYQAKTYGVIVDVSATQQQLTMLTHLLERDLRNSGYMIADRAAVCGADNTNDVDTLFVSDSSAISTIAGLAALDTTGTNDFISDGRPDGPGLGIALTASSNTTTAGTTTITLSQSSIDTTNSYDNDGDGTDDTDFQFGTWGAVSVRGGVILIDTTDASNGVACGIITGVTGNTLTVDWKSPAISTATPANMAAIPAHVYDILPAAAGVNPPQLRRNGLVIASDVEDLQISFFYDLDDDGIVDAGESRGEWGGTAYTATDGNIGALLRDVTITMVSTTPFEEVDGDASGRPQDIGNHDVTSTTPTADRFRRRILSSTVRPRNVGNEL